jgi:alpha-L-fucosidase
MKRSSGCRLLFGIAVIIANEMAASANPPAPLLPLPSRNQLGWQSMELTAFAHFGVNTFYDQEWGNGTEDPNRFYPTNFDASQWAAILKNAGFKELILTCKHHDGFCLWPTAYTDHSVKSSRWFKERETKSAGGGDVVKAVADACHHAGIKFGVYLSPWDRNNPAYGKGEAYNTYYENQLRELLSNYGEVDEVWWDGAKGDNTPQNYNFGAWAAIVHRLQPHAVIFQGNYDSADIRWVGNENGHASEACWSAVNRSEDTDHVPPAPDGAKWMPAETDVSIRPGWFYHQSEDALIKSVSQLMSIYKDSVGRNSQLLLNIPPDRDGLISDGDKTRLMEFRRALDETYGNNLARDAKVFVSNTRGAGFEAKKALGGEPGRYWAATDGITNASLTIDLGAKKHFNLIELQEPIQLGLRVTGYNLEIWDGNVWTSVATQQCIGHKAIVSFPPVDASRIRLNITSARACPAISAIEIYNDPSIPIGKSDAVR